MHFARHNNKMGYAGRDYFSPGQLSGRKQQQVGLASELTVDPGVLLMDETFSGLAPSIPAQMQEDLADLQRNLKKSIIVITPDLDEAMIVGDRNAIMEDGGTIDHGAPKKAELLQRNHQTPPAIMRFKSGFLVLAGLGFALLVSFLVHRLDVPGALEFPVDIGNPLTNSIDGYVEWMVINLAWFFDAISDNLKLALGKLRDFLVWVPWPVTVATVLVVGWKVATFKIGLSSAVALAFIGAVDLWESAMITVAIMLVSVAISVIIGLAIGVLASRSNLVDASIRPLLDGMQTMPAFVYLVPGIMFFGLGNVPAVIATVLYSIPPCIRLTNLGIRQVDPSVVEAGRAFGSSRIQLLTKVQIPLAVPTIMAGINQTVMLALAMATIAAMVGAGGLGLEVLRAMGQLEQGDAFVAGVAIVILAIIVDRISQGYINSRRRSTE